MAGDDDVHKAIDRLYGTFAPYRLHHDIEGCPCCVGPADDARIRSKPLHLLSAQDLSRYAHKALTTWGTVDDYKHFLPRLLELIVVDPAFDEAELPPKLRLAQWHHWPAQERHAIDAYLRTLWRSILVSEVPRPMGRPVDDWFTFIGGIADDMAPYLMLWHDSPAVSARRHLASFVCRNSWGITSPAAPSGAAGEVGAGSRCGCRHR